MVEFDFVKHGYRDNLILAAIGEDLTDEGFNALLNRAFIRLNSGLSLADLFADEVNRYLQWYRETPEPEEVNNG